MALKHFNFAYGRGRKEFDLDDMNIINEVRTAS